MKTQSSYHNVLRFRAGKRILLGVAALLLLASDAQGDSSQRSFPTACLSRIAWRLTPPDAYITDASDDQILKFVPGTGALTLLAGGSPGTNSGVGPLWAEFNNPLGIVAARGACGCRSRQPCHSFCQHQWRRQRRAHRGRVGQGGHERRSWPSALFNFPSGIAADAQGNL